VYELGLGAKYTPGEITTAQKFQDDNWAAIELLDQAISKPICYCPMSHGSSPMYGMLRSAAREANSRATLLALSGNTLAAAERETDGYKVERQCAQNQGEMPYFVAVAIEQITTNGLGSIMNHSKPNAELSRIVIDAVRQSESAINQVRALQGDPAVLMSEFEPVETAIKSNAAFSDDDKKFQCNMLDAVKARYLHFARMQVAAVIRLQEFSGNKTSSSLGVIEHSSKDESATALLSGMVATYSNMTGKGSEKDPVVSLCPLSDLGTSINREETRVATDNELLAGATILAV
jgi:hypothetical protein